MSRVLKMPLDWHYPRTNTGTFAMFDYDGDDVRIGCTDTLEQAVSFVEQRNVKGI